MRRLLQLAACLIASMFACASAHAAELYYYSDFLLEMRGRDCRDESGLLWPNLQTLKRAADGALKQQPLSVVSADRQAGDVDAHDYLSYAPYYWPDPKKEDGLPWINRDGERNPTSEAMPNRRDWSRLQGCLRDLCLAWHFTGDERYAKHAALLARTWFLDETTRMNPNLEHAQGVPGRSDGSGWGIIDWAQVPALLDHITMLESWQGWTEADRTGIRQWFSEYRDWLLRSNNGKVAANAKNNHATYYDGQIVSISLFLGDRETARQFCEAAGDKRFAHMIAADGSQPLELRRTKSWDYSIYNLQAMVNLARLAEAVDVDLWHYRDDEGAGIREALMFLLPYAQGEQEWQWKQIKEIHYGGYISMLNELAYVDADESLPYEIGLIPETMGDSDARLLYQW
ncbi:MAG: alginate lyase family protein [Planctomycetales bacterium]|nr:alginate lyase family protein [bacterium]UNM08346.1 MAG: alginate lyase family protein [Planctomycetales bacterium]